EDAGDRSQREGPGIMRPAELLDPSAHGAESRGAAESPVEAGHGIQQRQRARRVGGPGAHLDRSTGVISTAVIAGAASSLRRSWPTATGSSAPSTGTMWASTSSCLGPTYTAVNSATSATHASWA